MNNSKRYKSLVKRIDFLNRNILPIINPTGDYTETEIDLTRSYILLVHAEVENYLEDIVSDKILNCFTLWFSSRKKSSCITSVLAFCGDKISFDTKRDTPEKKEKIEHRIEKNINYYKSIIFSNHGIKKSNILNLLLPIGIERYELDDTWLSIMENFGSNRGLIAHKSLSVQNPIDPQSERNLINNIILPELKKIDYQIIKLT